ncbi:D-glycero-alpha-D-manno-heptose-1,7-bisphosphate 7-phosphatase [Streptomyces sp. NPDC059740]|uniref:D-glycero-alpha-D-manno-heptose-1,7-bisphosphate 7-phosphatase n=1 Tax=Streptomyces sp. NPDC059740 TaxID=3346926 RepID=UPI0036613E93
MTTPTGRPDATSHAPAAVLFDRDGTLVEDVPYNADPTRVRVLPGVREALALLRHHGVATGVVSNQSGVGRGLLTEDDVRRVNARIDTLLGPFDVWCYCPHHPDEGCPCRKPRPGLVLTAARTLGVAPRRCAVVGDIGADMAAARAAGARAVLVPTAVTRPEEVRARPRVAPDALTAVRWLLAGTETASDGAPRPARPQRPAATTTSDNGRATQPTSNTEGEEVTCQ